MHLVRYALDDLTTGIGVRDDDGRLRKLPFRSMAEALQISVHELRNVVEAARGTVGEPARWLPPVDGRTEVWASGVTYRRSQEARMEESQTADIYALVADADRPELFFKAVAWRVVTDGDPIGIRADSALNVPEPELAVVVNADGEAIGYTVCNDITSRSIEGENPLYLPQAKVYAGSCAIATGIRPAWEVANPLDLDISCVVTRNGVRVWSAQTSTSAMKRSLDELISWLYRQDAYPEGVILSTGTGLVPDLDLTVHEGDVIDIEIAEVGRLRNHVAVGTAPFSWLRQRLADRDPAEITEGMPT